MDLLKLYERKNTLEDLKEQQREEESLTKLLCAIIQSDKDCTVYSKPLCDRLGLKYTTMYNFSGEAYYYVKINKKVIQKVEEYINKDNDK